MALWGLQFLALLPLKLIYTTILYYVGRLPERKSTRKLKWCLKMAVSRLALSMPLAETRLINLLLTETVIKWVVGVPFKLITLKLPGYGERFDENSFWLVRQPNRKPSDPVVLYLHGGGFYIQTQGSQIEGILLIYKLLDPAVQTRTSVLVLDYKLVSSGHAFPTQLAQLHSTYSRLSMEASNITLLGDSAGGNLAVAYPQYASLVTKNTDENVIHPKKLVLISPWIKLDPPKEDYVPGKSYYDNEKYDMITYKVPYFSGVLTFLGEERLDDLHISPGSKRPILPSDWNTIPTFGSPEYDIFCILGEDESFRDDILDWFKNVFSIDAFDKSGPNSVFRYSPGTYQFERKNVSNSANISLHVEPQGIHDSSLFFETHLLKQIAGNEKQGKRCTVDNIDKDEFYGLVRIARFLNETL